MRPRDIPMILRDLNRRIEQAENIKRLKSVADDNVKRGRAELIEAMDRAGTKTWEGEGYRATRRSRRHPIVTNRDALIESIQHAGCLDDYFVFDIATAKKDAIKAGWDGVEEETRAEVAIMKLEAER